MGYPSWIYYINELEKIVQPCNSADGVNRGGARRGNFIGATADYDVERKDDVFNS